MTATSSTQDSSLIEEDIRRTQDEMSRTVDQIGQQLAPRNLINSLLNQAESIDLQKLLDGARRNPLALAMIAGGAVWLVSDQDAKLPWRRKRAHEEQDGNSDVHHRRYAARMNKLSSPSRRGGAAVSRVQNLYSAAPLVGGLVAAGAGAVLGGLLPTTQIEEKQLSGVGEKLRDAAVEQKEKLISVAQDRKEQWIANVKDRLGG